MADNRKMVATCQGSTCRKTLTSAAEKNAYGSLAFSLQNERNLPTAATLRDGLDVPHTRNISLGQKNTLPKYSVYGKATNCWRRGSTFYKPQR